MKRIWIVFLILGIFSTGYSQVDTVALEEADTTYYLLKRNSFGANLSPLFTTAFGGNNKPSKVTFMYKRNFGEKNLRISVNYLNLANKTPYYSYTPIGSTDTSITNRYFGAQYNNYDVRIGFEELKGAHFSQFHIGADLILGYAHFNSSYNDITLIKDSSDNYVTNGSEPNYTGKHNSYYYMTGLDVSFGFDWFLSEEFTLTLQLTPQFNFYIADWERLEDQYKQYEPIKNFADFSLSYFDILLFYRF